MLFLFRFSKKLPASGGGGHFVFAKAELNREISPFKEATPGQNWVVIYPYTLPLNILLHFLG